VAAEAIDRALGPHLSEPRIARELGRSLPPEATLVVSASMPIRDVETFMPVRAEPLRVLSNRGANGIDGVVSTAFGVAAGSDGPVVCLIGDVALAHDLGGLLAARRLRLPLTIVLQDNEGGGIFDFLPVAATARASTTRCTSPRRRASTPPTWRSSSTWPTARRSTSPASAPRSTRASRTTG
jgi:2-succinyl-5-enolpyruvyl-6-hydroxy-3-cyclohexene-1-carboxylate synthase